MAPAALPQWNPTTDADLKLKGFLQSLGSSMDSAMLIPGPKAQLSQDGEKAHFLLQSKAYFDLKAYVMTGKDFPVDDDAFNGRITKDAFKRLETVDGVDTDIYNKTKATCVGIGSTCRNFYDDELHNIPMAGAVAKRWSQSTLDILTDEDETMTLLGQLRVVFDPKYKLPADEDHDYIMAKSRADASLMMLHMAANDAEEEARDILIILEKFRDDTKPFINDLNDLIKKYSKTPVKHNNREFNGYLAFLQADYADAVHKLKDSLKDYNSKDNDWKTDTGAALSVGLTFSWIPLLGWATLGSPADTSDYLRQNWERVLEEYKALRVDNTDEAVLVDLVTKMVFQFEGIDQTIELAVDSVNTLRRMFQDQAECYEGIRSMLGGFEIGASSSEAQQRREFIDKYFEMVVRKLKALNGATVGFLEAIYSEDTSTFRKM
ncbi:hypothetical protein QBC41DRAFT_338899 [Cercophora samala]|uniref:Uncharacterized protein n=1 Tax=Cercophora samala TaxID=330535 RepID=A0AA39Z9J8_9PEZI|nr:hypothetical protein QBC41DRAFT_338899 [Cercophora samala]